MIFIIVFGSLSIVILIFYHFFGGLCLECKAKMCWTDVGLVRRRRDIRIKRYVCFHCDYEECARDYSEGICRNVSQSSEWNAWREGRNYYDYPKTLIGTTLRQTDKGMVIEGAEWIRVHFDPSKFEDLKNKFFKK